MVITCNSAYNEVAFNKKLSIMKENIHTKYTSFTYKYVTLNEKLPIMKQNLCIFFLWAELSVQYRWVPLKLDFLGA